MLHAQLRVAFAAALALALGACQTRGPVAGGAPEVTTGPASVAALQPPVWLERDGLRGPLLPGAGLRPGDWVITGAKGRAHLRLADGSMLQLGENTTVDVQQLAFDRSVLWGSLKLVRGALRITAAPSGDGRRDLNLAVGEVISARVNGSDVCAQVQRKRSSLCLVAGKIEAQTEAGAPVALQEPSSRYVVAAGQAPQTQTLPAPRLSALLRATELQAKHPVLVAAGTWGVGLAAESNDASATRSLGTAWAKGLPVQRMEVEVGGRRWHRIALVGFENARDARRYAAQLNGQDYRGAWVFKRD